MAQSVCVKVAELAPGRRLRFPIHDCRGALLINAGVELTVEFRERLMSRGVTQVMLDESDALELVESPARREALEFAKVERAVDAYLDSLIRSGQLQSLQRGPALAQRAVQHGRAPYDPKTLAAVRRSQAQNLSNLSGAIERLAKGRAEVLDLIERIVVGNVEYLVSDLACTVCATLSGTVVRSISEHSYRMAMLGMAIGVEMELDAHEVRTIGAAGLLADLGMVGVRSEVRDAARQLTSAEFVEIQRHAVRTANLLERLGTRNRMEQLIAYQVHERPDGSGYPRGRTLKSIHPFARILHVADAYAAMTSARAYRPPMVPYVAMESLIRQASLRKVDAAVVRAILQVLSLFPIGSYVVLSDGGRALTVRPNGPRYSQPLVARLPENGDQEIGGDGASVLVDLAEAGLEIVRVLPRPGSGEIAVDVRRN